MNSRDVVDSWPRLSRRLSHLSVGEAFVYGVMGGLIAATIAGAMVLL